MTVMAPGAAADAVRVTFRPQGRGETRNRLAPSLTILDDVTVTAIDRPGAEGGQAP